MATVRSNFAELLEPGLRKIFFKEFAMEPMRYPELFNVQSSSKAYEDTLDVAGLGVFATKPEGTPISYKDPVQGTKKRVVHSTYALGFRVTLEMMQDDQYAIINKMPADLGEAARQHQETLVWGLVNDGWTGATYTGLDGRALFYATHDDQTSAAFAHPESSTQSNIAAPGVALSITGLEAAITAMRVTTSPEGRYTPITPSVLLIHPDNAHEAVRILQTEKEPFTNENQVNTMTSSRTGIRDLVVPYLTDTDAWSVYAVKSQHTLTVYKRMGLTFSRGTDSQTKDALYDGMYRMSVTFDDWRGTYGSAPA
jgi:phage major head subunit gpT-like protein